MTQLKHMNPSKVKTYKFKNLRSLGHAENARPFAWGYVYKVTV